MGAQRKLWELTRRVGFPGKYAALLSYILGIPTKQTWAFPAIIDAVIVGPTFFAVVEDQREQYDTIIGSTQAVQAALQEILHIAELTEDEFHWFAQQAERTITIENPRKHR
ncbi:MAG TPA: hypothetical protein VFH61_11955 [Thermoleophilia bacterium]|nr:hypothetical protein [Thermoleophilia bacterium]